MLLRFALFLGAGLLPKRKLKGMFCPMRGGFFILQLHDELLYEVAEEDVVQVCCSVYYVGSRWWGSEWPVLCHVRCIGPSLPQAGCINVESSSVVDSKAVAAWEAQHRWTRKAKSWSSLKYLQWLSWSKHPYNCYSSYSLEAWGGNLGHYNFQELPELGDFTYFLSQDAGEKTSIQRNRTQHHPVED